MSGDRTAGEARRHHYVPEFLLKPWQRKGELSGYYWCSRRQQLCVRHLGAKAFCHRKDLLAPHGAWLAQDIFEKRFFQQIDAAGATARDLMLEVGPDSLTTDQRCDFARLLMSLEVRRPESVAALREDGRWLKEEVDKDIELQAATAAAGEDGPPSAFWERHERALLADRVFLSIQDWVDSKEVGVHLVNAYWHVIHLNPPDGTFVLADRPLVRVTASGSPVLGWFLPLSPTKAFVATSSSQFVDRIISTGPRKFARELNVDSTKQADNYVFALDQSHDRLLEKHLGKKSLKENSYVLSQQSAPPPLGYAAHLPP